MPIIDFRVNGPEGQDRNITIQQDQSITINVKGHLEQCPDCTVKGSATYRIMQAYEPYDIEFEQVFNISDTVLDYSANYQQFLPAGDYIIIIELENVNYASSASVEVQYTNPVKQPSSLISSNITPALDITDQSGVLGKAITIPMVLGVTAGSVALLVLIAALAGRNR